MNCPHCGAPAFVRDSRLRASGARYRRYECFNGHRFTTLERVKS